MGSIPASRTRLKGLDENLVPFFVARSSTFFLGWRYLVVESNYCLSAWNCLDFASLYILIARIEFVLLVWMARKLFAVALVLFRVLLLE